jgi:hypothetical protein
MDLNTLRSRRNNDFSKITQELEKTNTNSHVDNRFWKPERDKAGNATATIRFLARTEGDELPWVKVFSHGFKGPAGRWFIEDCLTSLNKSDGSACACPACELNSQMWNSTTDEKSPIRDQVRKQKRKLNYITNILVVNDPKHPENNGKVFLYKFGKKIFDKIMDKARPTFEDEEPVNVFDYWDGANFKLRMKQVDGYPNYDASEFESPSPLAKTDEEILEVVKQQHKLSEFLDPSKFKSYDDMKKKLTFVMAGTTVPETKAEDFAERTAPAPTAKSKPAPSLKEDSDEDMMDYFQKLADEDDDAPF